MSKPFAVFDIDGTIIRWQLFHAIVDELGKQKALPPEEVERIHTARHKWKTRAHTESFREYELEMVRIFQKFLVGLEVETYANASHKVFEKYKDQVYRYTRGLISSLKEKDYVLFAISGSPAEAVRPFAEYYGFDDFIATTFEKDGDTYTGSIQSSHQGKDKFLKQLVAKHNLNLSGSIGVGDSEGDITMLALTENPIAFNPSKKLFDHAKQHSWQVVVERKNVIYELSDQNGVYVLED